MIFCWPALALANFYFYFHLSFERYQVYSQFDQQYSQFELTQQFNTVLAHINPPFTSDLDPDFFSIEDILHMQDVRNLFIIFWLVTISSTIVYVVLRRQIRFTQQSQVKEQIINSSNRRIVLFISVLTFATILLLLTWKSSFKAFHRILFPFNQYWSLDPQTSNLIKFLPEEIFQELLIMYLLLVTCSYLIVQRLQKSLTKLGQNPVPRSVG